MKTVILAISLIFGVLLQADTTFAEPKPSFNNPRKVVFLLQEEVMKRFIMY